MEHLLDPFLDNVAWKTTGATNLQLAQLMEMLYWEGVTREICHAIKTVKIWKDIPELPIEGDSSKAMPLTGQDFVEIWAPWETSEAERNYLQARAQKRTVGEARISEGNVETYLRCEDHQSLSCGARRARMCLQGLGLLDVEKVMESRPAPIRTLEGTAQVVIGFPPSVLRRGPDGQGIARSPVPRILHCSECKQSLRSTFFACLNGCPYSDPGAVEVGAHAYDHTYRICAHCYTTTTHEIQHFGKMLPEDPLAGPRSPMEHNVTLGVNVQKNIKTLRAAQDKKDDHGKLVKRALFKFAPEPLKKTLFPYGNAHALVMFGPLNMEIGAGNSKRGALISLRQPPDLSFSDRWAYNSMPGSTPAIAVSPTREIFVGVRDRPGRIIHASEKQVLGGLFCGHIPSWQRSELDTIEALFTSGSTYEDVDHKTWKQNHMRLRKLAQLVVDAIKAILEDEVQLYLQHFASKLTTIELQWSQFFNNCQKFCGNLLSGPIFASPFSRQSLSSRQQELAPHYLVSFLDPRFRGFRHQSIMEGRVPPFVGRPLDESSDDLAMEIKLETPTSAYFRAFHAGRDVIEHFQQQSGYPYLERTCEQLYGLRCRRGCSVSEHIWSMPYETLSLTQLYLLRSRLLPVHREKVIRNVKRAVVGTTLLLNDKEWVENRILILLALDIFLGSASAIICAYEDLIDSRNDAASKNVHRGEDE